MTHGPPKPKPGSVVKTADGSLTLSHGEHGECYHTQAGAETEARQLYVEASGIAARFTAVPPSELAILDVGLGLGYNALVTIDAWLAAPAPGPLHLQSLEIDKSLVENLASGEASWQENWSPTRRAHCELLRRDRDGNWRAVIRHPANQAACRWSILVGDARTAALPAPRLPGWHFVWQDPFSPEKNPGMWNAEWFAKAGKGAAPGCVLMTYSVARVVRDGLTAAGWDVEKIPSLIPAKRHWLKARWPQ